MTLYLKENEVQKLRNSLKTYDFQTEDGTTTLEIKHYASIASSSSNQTENNPLILFLHGFGEHSESFEPYFQYLQNSKFTKNFDLLIYDQRGHGKKLMRRDAVVSMRFEKLSDDLISISKLVKEKFPDRPLYLHGDSMGGALILWTALRTPPLLAYKGITIGVFWGQKYPPKQGVYRI